MALFEKQEISHVQADRSIILQAGGDIVLDKDLFQNLTANQQNPKLFQRLIREKIELCKTYILKNDIAGLKRTTDTIFNYGLNGIPEGSKQILYFYRFLLAVFEKDRNGMEDCMDQLQDGYLEEAEILFKFQAEPGRMEFQDYRGLSAEAQLAVLDLSFEKGSYAEIEELYQDHARETGDAADFLKYYAALSAFNLQQYEEASRLFGEAGQFAGRARNQLLQMLSAAQIEMLRFDREGTGREELEKIFYRLEEIKKADEKTLSGCALVMALTELQMAVWLSPERFMEIFESYGAEIREDPNVQIFLGLYYELCSEHEKAIAVYQNADWKNEKHFLFRLLLANLLLRNYEEVLRIYDSASEESKTGESAGVWLSALKQQGGEGYDRAVRENAEKYKGDIGELFYIALSADHDRKLFEELFLGEILGRIEEVKQSALQVRLGYAVILLDFEYAGPCYEILSSMDKTPTIDETMACDFYQCLCKYRLAQVEACGKGLPRGEAALYLEQKVQICDWFIERRIRSDLFLREKANCLLLQKKNISLLSCTKELYETTHEEEAAVNVIALLLEGEMSPKSDLEHYIQELKGTKRPRSLIALAAAYKRMGRTKEAGFCLYKAVFFLNGEEDFGVLNPFLKLHHEMIYDHHHAAVDFDEVADNTVVTLREAGGSGGVEHVCLDSELELEEMTPHNFSMGVRHFCSKDPGYLRLQNKKPGQPVRLDGKEFVVESILSREVYAFRYVLDLCTRNPERSNVKKLTVQDGTLETVWEAIKEATRRSGPKGTPEEGRGGDARLDFYHFKDNTVGLPIDALVQKDYDNYMDVVGMLLYGEGQALYAGDADMEKMAGHKIVATLSSLAVMCRIGRLDLLEELADQVMVPASLMEFLNQRVRRSIELQAVSPGRLIEMPDGSPAMLSVEQEAVDMWSAIYELCLKFEKVGITDQERLQFDAIEGMDAEVLFSSLQIGRMQMDCMILAKQRDAVYLSDDLFLRKVASKAGIKNTNFTSLALSLSDRRKAADICMELSKTNYMRVPLLYGSMEEAAEMWRNLLSSDKKVKYYGPSISRMFSNAAMTENGAGRPDPRGREGEDP